MHGSTCLGVKAGDKTLPAGFQRGKGNGSARHGATLFPWLRPLIQPVHTVVKSLGRMGVQSNEVDVTCALNAACPAQGQRPRKSWRVKRARRPCNSVRLLATAPSSAQREDMAGVWYANRATQQRRIQRGDGATPGATRTPCAPHPLAT